MTPQWHLIDRGLAITKRIAELQEELEDVELSLIAAAKVNPNLHIELEDKEREGRQFIAEGSTHRVPIVFTADKLIGSFSDASILRGTIERAAAPHLTQFYRCNKTWEMVPKNGKAFRQLAGQLLGPKNGPALITTCVARDKHGVAKSDIKVEWKRAEGKAS